MRYPPLAWATHAESQLGTVEALDCWDPGGTNAISPGAVHDTIAAE